MENTENMENTGTSETIQTPATLQGKYQYLDLLGEGSNGKTYRAKELNTGNLVAIKELKLSQSENFKSFELFRREAEVLESVRIEGVPRFYESIVSDKAGGECYIVQEFVEAPSIQSYLSEGRVFNEVETGLLIQAVCRILCQLHLAYTPPIIHRDIKPSNILCEMPQGEITRKSTLMPYLIDFGAVANPQKKSGGSTIAGTLGYMAPEQMMGDCECQSDFYALGATALHMLTGMAPYDIETADVFKLDYEKTIRQYAPSTSAHMIKLVGKMLQKNSSDRPANAKELLDSVERVLNGMSPDPNDDAVPEKKPNRLLRLFDKTDPTNWISVPGMVRAYVINNVSRCVEYTFMTKSSIFRKSKLYVGQTEWSELSADSRKRYEVPFPCTVMYCPVEPGLSILVSIQPGDAKPMS